MSRLSLSGGCLVLVSTPLGNLGDLSPRAVTTLQGCALICCEDTRHSGKLLAHAGVAGVRLAVANEHTEHDRTAEVLRVLAEGHDVGVVTDAGTPGISDPGMHLVRAAIDAGFAVSAVPGPAALVMALVVSGLDTTRFAFEGFLPRSGSERTERIAEVAAERRTVVLYEAPQRVAATLADLADACGGGRRVALCRELTKLHEEVWRGTLDDAVAHVAGHPPKGEYVLVLEPAPAPEPPTDDELRALLDAERAAGASARDAAARVAAATGEPPNRVKRLASG
ncbi:MAG: 16S rRNA (cytidine(1402)-2'-O)-methyltransferase [Ilumatobacteraceae bacterium]